MKQKCNVLPIANSDQCCHCGTCLGVCPRISNKQNLYIQSDCQKRWALNVRDHTICEKCHLCLKVCPMYRVDYNILEKALYGKEDLVFQHQSIGFYKNCYVGHVADEKTRENGASGGCITGLLMWLFQKKIIDGALILSRENGDIQDTKGKIVSSEEEVFSSAKSCYFPVPVMSALQEIFYGSYKKVAVVGLPCQLTALRKAQLFLPNLKEKIILTLGLFCGYNSSYRLADHLASRLEKHEGKSLKNFNFRVGKWPGNIMAEYQDGSSEIIAGSCRDNVAFSAILPACLYCVDQFNELADISFGDAWLENYLQKQDGGYSIIISRSILGQKLIDKMLNDNVLKLDKLDIHLAEQSQRGPLDFKKRGFRSRKLLGFLFTANTPSILNARLMKGGFVDIFSAFLLLCQIRISKWDWYWKVIDHQKSKTIEWLNKPMYFLQNHYDLLKRIKKKLLHSLKK